jgi:hypothetical protein
MAKAQTDDIISQRLPQPSREGSSRESTRL